MPNLVKQRFVVENKEQTRVINSNEKLEQLIGQAGKEGFTPGLFAKDVDVAFLDREKSLGLTGIEALVADPDNPELDEVSSNGVVGQEADAESLELSRQQAEDIIQQARIQADEILADAREDARQEAETVKQQAYEQGIQLAQEETQRLKQHQQEEFLAATQQQKADYQQQLEQMEPELVDVILSVVQDVLHVEIEDYRPIILDLVKQTMMQADNPKELSILANEDNCAYIKENSDGLRAIAGEETRLEILTNQQLSDQECRIETEFGIYDCGFDVQLKNLSNRIRLLSHQKE